MSRIFILDDHEMVRDGLRGVIEAAGHTVTGSTGCMHEALRATQERAMDVLMLDLHLDDGVSGLQVLEAMRSGGYMVRTLVLTMSSQPRHVSEAFRLGATGYVLKGSPSAELMLAIESVMRDQPYLCEKIRPLAAAIERNGIATRALDTLSPRELQILQRVVSGQTSAQIAAELMLSPKTVDTYRSRLMAKLAVGDLPSLVKFAIQHGLLDLGPD